MVKETNLPASCIKCGLYKSCKKYRLPMKKGSSNPPRILVIGEAPGLEEDKTGEPFVGRSGQLLEEALCAILPSNIKVWKTNAVKCRPEGNKLKSITPVKQCYEYTLQDIKTCDPDIIVLCGATAYRQIVDSGSIMSVRGRVVTKEICGRERKVLPVFHPAYILRNVGKLGVWESDLSQLDNIIKGNTPTLPDYTEVTFEEIESLITEVGWFSLDIETNNLLDFTDKRAFITCISVSTLKDGEIYASTIKDLKKEKIDTLARLLGNTKLLVVGHNIKFDLSWILYYLNLECKCNIFDTQVAYSVLVNEEESSSLKTLAYTFTNFGGYEADIRGKVGKGAEWFDYNWYSSELQRDFRESLYKYNIIDTIATMEIYLNLREKAEEDMNLYRLLYGVFFPLIKVLVKIEVSGVKLDVDLLYKYADEIDKRINQYADEFKRQLTILGQTGSYSYSSPEQMAKLFYDILKLPIIERTENNNPSVAKDTIEQILTSYIKEDDSRYKILETYIALKSLLTIKGLCIEKFKDKVESGFLYPRYSLVRVDRSDYAGVEAGGTITTRLSSANPNLQQMPGAFEKTGSKVEDIEAEALNGINIHKLVKSRFPDGYILKADFSQIELRWACVLSGDEGMLRAYQNKIDLHSLTASEIYNVPIENVTPAQRKRCKMANFGIIYGQGASNFAKRWGISLPEAQQFIDKYFEQRKGLYKFIQDTKEEVRKNGFVRDYFGKIRHLGNIWSEDKYIQSSVERQAVNFKCQSSASIMALLSLLRISKKITENNLTSKIIGTVHDSILLDCPKNELDVVKDIVTNSMTRWDGLNLPIPIEIDISYATSWGGAE